MLQKPHELVVGNERVAVLPAHVAALDKRLERVHRGCDAQRLIHPPVHHLEQLDGEFHVAQPAPAQLELTGFEVLGNVADHPAAHGLHVLNKGASPGRLPHQRVKRDDVIVTQSHVAGLGARLEQRLKFPRFRPTCVVGLVRFERANKRPVFALGPKRGIDVKQRLGTDADEFARHTRRLGCCGFRHEHHVHVGDVVELPRATFTQCDDGKPGVGRVLAPHCPLGAREGGGERRVGEGGEHGCDVRIRQRYGHRPGVGAHEERAGQVNRSDAHEQGAIRVFDGSDRVPSLKRRAVHSRRIQVLGGATPLDRAVWSCVHRREHEVHHLPGRGGGFADLLP